MIVPNNKYCIYNTYVLITIKIICILIEKLIFLFHNFIIVLKIMSIVVVIIVFKNKDTPKKLYVLLITYLFTINF